MVLRWLACKVCSLCGNVKLYKLNVQMSNKMGDNWENCQIQYGIIASVSNSLVEIATRMKGGCWRLWKRRRDMIANLREREGERDQVSPFGDSFTDLWVSSVRV